ncbi:hemolysin family protein [Longirhabdus pacifica]|uniref:hemolysin family protein n=1 Tax=Longirhabdus pacifica TaxID=2305227 RepID=UPI00100879BB|nr:hemolysin family protein [Longirhabdus pacifica]
MLFIEISIVVLLILATAFFVAAEFSFVKVRPSRIDQLVLSNHPQALAAKKVTTHLNEYLSACQLGITITSLGLGWMGETTVEKLLHPLFDIVHLGPNVTSTISFIIAFSIITFLHVVLGELVPKTFAIEKAERISLMLAKPMIWFYRIMFPVIWALNNTAIFFVKLLGLKEINEHDEVHSEEELRLILSESYKSGEINQSEYKYVNNIFEFDELKAREIMVPRTDMICLYTNKSLEENLQTMKDQHFTRFPIVDENKDNVIGILNTKQFFLKYMEDPNLNIKEVIRPIFSISESTPIKELLIKMQQERVQMAILYDEYGGTAGLVTVEDILEEIVGDIRDEFDSNESSEIERLNDHTYVFDGKVLISDVNHIFNVVLDEEDFDTIGGWLYAHNPVLKEGQVWKHHTLTFTVRERDKHRYRKIEVTLTTE